MPGKRTETVEIEMFIALLLLPVVRAQGVADDDGLIEAGVEVKRQIRGLAAEIDGKAFSILRYMAFDLHGAPRLPIQVEHFKHSLRQRQKRVCGFPPAIPPFLPCHHTAWRRCPSQ